MKDDDSRFQSHLNDLWAEYLYPQEEEKEINISPELLKELEQLKLEKADLDVTCEGVGDSKSLAEAKLYTKHELNADQKKEIKKAFEVGLTLKQVKLYAVDPNKSAETMALFTWSFENDFTFDQVKFMARYNKYNEVRFIIYCFLANITKEEIRFALEKLDVEQVRVIAEHSSIYGAISFETISLFIEGNYTCAEILGVMSCSSKGLKKEQMDLYNKFHKLMKSRGLLFDQYQIEEILKGFMNGRTIKEVCLYADPSYDHNDMKQFRLFERKVTYEQAKIAKSKKFTFLQTEQILQAFYFAEMTIEQVKLFAVPEFSEKTMESIIKCFNENLFLSQIKALAKRQYSHEQIDFMRDGFKKGLKFKEIKLFTKVKGFFELEEIQRGFENGLTYEQVAFYAKPDMSSDRMRKIRESFEAGKTIDDYH